jgi:hypothetical protein
MHARKNRNKHAGLKVKPVFHFNRIVAKRISLFPEHWSGTDDFGTKENATVRYDTVEVENRLKNINELNDFILPRKLRCLKEYRHA